MNEHDAEILKKARERKGTHEPERFRAWLKGFRMVGREESEELKRKLDKMTEEAEE